MVLFLMMQSLKYPKYVHGLFLRRLHKSSPQCLIRGFPEDSGGTGQLIYIFCSFGRWAVTANGPVVLRKTRERE